MVAMISEGQVKLRILVLHHLWTSGSEWNDTAAADGNTHRKDTKHIGSSTEDIFAVTHISLVDTWLRTNKFSIMTIIRPYNLTTPLKILLLP